MTPQRIKETQAFFNKQYRDATDGEFLLAVQRSFLKTLREAYEGETPEHLYYADDCLVIYRNLGFLKDKNFISACVIAELDEVIYGRIWRIWVLACTMLSRWKKDGAIVDCGTYNGKALKTAISYCLKMKGPTSQTIYAYDLFDNPPGEAKKIEHGPKLLETVQRRLADLGSVKVVKGRLPEVIDLESHQKISWAQIDLNSAEHDLETFLRLYPMLTDGAIVIFDDYGFSRYSKTQTSIDALLAESGERVLELPTGQGMYIHTKA